MNKIETFSMKQPLSPWGWRKMRAFGSSPWINGLRPKDTSPENFKTTKKNKSSVIKALDTNAWVGQIDLRQGIGMEHIEQFVTLWDSTSYVHLNVGTKDSIRWKFSHDGNYTEPSAYKMQFEGLASTPLDGTVWKRWAPLQCKFFTWLVLQNMI
jgi:hypothetical protein